jgi:prepilin-type N-terminal cleavage/methylation domain-containing protein
MRTISIDYNRYIVPCRFDVGKLINQLEQLRALEHTDDKTPKIGKAPRVCTEEIDDIPFKFEPKKCCDEPGTDSGHTFTELLAVLALIALLAGLALPALATAYSHSRDLSQASAILYDAKIEAALDERPDGTDGFEVLQVLDGISPGQLASILRENRTAVGTSGN